MKYFHCRIFWNGYFHFTEFLLWIDKIVISFLYLIKKNPNKIKYVIVISKSLSMLGFIRNYFKFTDPTTIVCLHNCLVRTHLEYCSVIWNPIYVSNCFRIEKGRKKGLFFFKLGWQIKRPCYLTRCALFSMSTLENRRKIFSFIFIRNLIQAFTRKISLGPSIM